MSQFGNRVPLKPVLGGARASLLFSFLWCVLCFRRIFIQNLYSTIFEHHKYLVGSVFAVRTEIRKIKF